MNVLKKYIGIILVCAILLGATANLHALEVSKEDDTNQEISIPFVEEIQLSETEIAEKMIQEHERPFGSDENHLPYPDQMDNFSLAEKRLEIEDIEPEEGIVELENASLPQPIAGLSSADEPVIQQSNNTGNSVLRASNTPTIYISNITQTTITVTVLFPSGGINNQLQIYYPDTGWQTYNSSYALQNGSYVITGLKPYLNYGFVVWSQVNGTWVSAETAAYTLGDGSRPTVASLTASSITINSITLNVVFPTGRQISSPQLIVSTLFGSSYTYGNNLNLPNGTYTFSGLHQGSDYRYTMYWMENGSWQSKYLDLTTMLTTPEKLTRTDGAHIFLNLESADTALFGSGKYMQWISRLDRIYESYQELTGFTPYSGNKIEIRSTRENVGYWAAAGNPIIWARKGIPRQINQTNVYDDACFGIAHEISHDFDSTRYWNFDGEFFANFKMAYALHKTAYKVCIPNGESGYVDSTIKSYYKSNAEYSYDRVLSTGVYHHDALTYTMLQIKDTIGWEPFKKTFAYFNGLSYKDAPNTNLEKLNLFLSKLKDFSGVDVFSLQFLPFGARMIYESKFEGVIEYLDTSYTIVILPGIMGSRLYKNHELGMGEMVWEPDEFHEGLFFEWLLRDSLAMNENGIPNETLLLSGLPSNAFGAMNLYWNILWQLRSHYENVTEVKDVKFFPYDWRYSCEINAANLESFLKDDDRVIIVAHSMGGLVASSFLYRSQQNRDKVEKLIAIASPFMGSVRALMSMETGEVLGDGIENDLLKNHIKVLSPNFPSVYELLPSQRYPQNYIGITNVNVAGFDLIYYSHSQAKSLLSLRPWARYSDTDTVKSMFNSAYNVQERWIHNGFPVTDYVDTNYIIGVGEVTPAKVVYRVENLSATNAKYDSLLYSGGDGVVLEQVANNGRNGYHTFNLDHNEIVTNGASIDKVIELIDSKLAVTRMTMRSDTHNTESDNKSLENRNERIVGGVFEDNMSITVVLDNAKNTTITNIDNMPITEEKGALLLTNEKGEASKIGVVWWLNSGGSRRQYVLPDGQYTISTSYTNNKADTEIIVMRFVGAECVDREIYTDLAAHGDATLHIGNEFDLRVEEASKDLPAAHIANKAELRSFSLSISSND